MGQSVPSSSGIISLTNAKSDEPMTAEQRIREVERCMEKRWKNDDVIFTRICKELDITANVKKEDQLINTGMTTEVPKPAGQVKSRQWLRYVVAAALDSLVQDTGAKITFVSPGRSLNGEIPLSKVKLKAKEWAAKVRREFGQLKREGKVNGRLFVANSVTLATRVRLEVLRSVAKVCSNANDEMFDRNFTSRPVLQV